MEAKWKCSKCKAVTTFDGVVEEELFKCGGCGNRILLPIVIEDELDDTEIEAGPLFRMCWKHKDFDVPFKGPILIHTRRSDKKPYTKDEALAKRDLYNLNHLKNGVKRFWIKEVDKKVPF